MKEICINQYQDFLMLNKNKGIIIDYLVGDFEIIYNVTDIKIRNEYSKEYEILDLEYENKKDRLNTDNITIVLIPTYKCNMECEYCYEGHIKTRSKHIGENNIKIIIETIKSITEKNRFINFILLGGEPITDENMKWFSDFFTEFQKESINYTVSCISNGLEISNNIEKMKQIGITYCQLTFDGTEEVHNKRKKSKIKNYNPFKQVCKAIDTLLKFGIDTTIRVNVDENNIKDLDKIIELLWSYDWPANERFSIYIYPISMSGNDLNKKYLSENNILNLVLKKLNEIPKEKRIYSLDFHGLEFINGIIEGRVFIPKFNFCSSCKNQYVFDSLGNVYTCWWGVDNPEFAIGKYNEFECQWDRDKIKKWHTHNVNNINMCKICKYKYICGGGCVFKAVDSHGKLESGNCAEFKEIIKTYLKYKFQETLELCKNE